jgi:hypothetical protein
MADKSFICLKCWNDAVVRARKELAGGDRVFALDGVRGIPKRYRSVK